MKSLVSNLTGIGLFVVSVVLAALVVFAVWWLGHRVYRYSVCAELPNGLLIGRAALFDYGKHPMDIGVVLKLADGTVLIPDYVDTFHFNNDAAYGLAIPMFRHDDRYSFAYRADAGLVLAGEDPDKYEDIVAAATPSTGAAEVLGYPTNRNLASAYYKLTESPAYRKTFCPLSIYRR